MALIPSIEFKSSNLKRAELHRRNSATDEQDTFAIVEFTSGDRYAYDNVTPEMFEAWGKAKSAGGWLDANLKKKPKEFPARKLPPTEHAATPPAGVVITGITFDDVDEDAKRDARVFYEAYGANANWKTFDGRAMPAWSDLNDAVRSHWAAVAVASRGTTHPDVTLDPTKTNAALRVQLNEVYNERNRVVAFLVAMAAERGWPHGLAEHDPNDASWDADWRGIVFIELPDVGQVSWHYHDSERPLFVGLPRYDKPWDGHSSVEKYDRMRRLIDARPWSRWMAP